MLSKIYKTFIYYLSLIYFKDVLYLAGSNNYEQTKHIKRLRRNHYKMEMFISLTLMEECLLNK